MGKQQLVQIHVDNSSTYRRLEDQRRLMTHGKDFSWISEINDAILWCKVDHRASTNNEHLYYRMLEHGPLSPLTRQKEINRSMGGDAFRTGRRHKQSVVAVSFETETDAS